MTDTYNGNRKDATPDLTASVIYPPVSVGQGGNMITTVELLAQLKAKNISNADVARTLGLAPSRITEMRKGERALKLEEAVKLVAVYGLSEQAPSQRVSPLPAPISRLVVRYLAAELGASPTEEQVAELAEDVRAFAEFVADPQVRESLDSAEAFFRAMRLRRPVSEPASQG
jgi:transcriptional regulator with XRE-family HTH domain